MSHFVLLVLASLLQACLQPTTARKATPEEIEDVRKELGKVMGNQFFADMLLSGPVFKSLEEYFNSETSHEKQQVSEGIFSNHSFCKTCRGLAPFVPVLATLLPDSSSKLVVQLMCRILEPEGSICVPTLSQLALPLLEVQRNSEGGLNGEYACWAISNTKCLTKQSAPNLLWDETEKNLVRTKRTLDASQNLKGRADAVDYKVIHLTDIHIDPEYETRTYGERKIGICTEPTNSQESEIVMGEFGYWEACGLPEKTFKSLVDHIKDVHHDASYIIETGDSPGESHDLSLYQRMKDYLAQNLPNIPIYPVIGNHDALPVNQFPPPSAKTSNPVNWLYKAAAKRWTENWLPPSARPSVEWTGVYVVHLPNNFRIITINTLYCFKLNWWVYTTTPDPGKQLERLRDELQAAEDAGDLVHIVGHVAPATPDCIPVWFHHYAKLVDRYSDTIRGEFYGHHHAHVFNVVHTDRDPNNRNSAKSVAFLGPSMHTLTALNPAYTVYTIDGNTKRVKDIEVWYLDIEEADRTGVPNWKKLYDFRSVFGAVPSHPQQWHDFVQQLKRNEGLMRVLYNLSMRGHSKSTYSPEKANDLLEYMEGYDKH
ncbi:unnamed protein product [Cyprideis torosa]|uniref:Sphingomyelin phosphodiesterase n=1 Tax=Cyprideis torosa TaxID=163714 RepID=A0A7R8W2Q7_9CRUS|nr:unnamed protein product [Cyprideis torosa]CAG0882217.1 unnamed protein product [Cyprideis torosa]